MLYKLVPPSRKTEDIQYIDGASDDKLLATLRGKGMSVVTVPAKKVGQGQTQIGYCKEPQFAVVRVESTRLAAITRVLERVAARRRPTLEEQLERLNAPQKAKKTLKPQRIFGCDVVEVDGEFVVYKDGVEVGRAKDRRGAQDVARANW